MALGQSNAPENIVASTLKGVQSADKGARHGEKAGVWVLAGALMAEEADREDFAQRGARLVERGRGQERVTLAEKLEATDKQLRS